MKPGVNILPVTSTFSACTGASMPKPMAGPGSTRNNFNQPRYSTAPGSCMQHRVYTRGGEDRRWRMMSEYPRNSATTNPDCQSSINRPDWSTVRQCVGRTDSDGPPCVDTVARLLGCPFLSNSDEARKGRHRVSSDKANGTRRLLAAPAMVI